MWSLRQSLDHCLCYSFTHHILPSDWSIQVILTSDWLWQCFTNLWLVHSALEHLALIHITESAGSCRVLLANTSRSFTLFLPCHCSPPSPATSSSVDTWRLRGGRSWRFSRDNRKLKLNKYRQDNMKAYRNACDYEATQHCKLTTHRKLKH